MAENAVLELVVQDGEGLGEEVRFKKVVSSTSEIIMRGKMSRRVLTSQLGRPEILLAPSTRLKERWLTFMSTARACRNCST